MSIVIAILVFGLIVFLHEMGHFLVAKASGIAVLQFNIGFGPALLKKRIHETVYVLRLLPLGGAVMFKSEDEDLESEELMLSCEIFEQRHPGKSGNFHEAPWIKRFLVTIAGSAVNLLSGIIILFILLIPAEQVITPTLSGLMDGFDYVGEEGFLPGDEIKKVNDFTVFVYGDVVTALTLGAGEPYDFVIERDGERVVLEDLAIEPKVYAETGDDVPRYGFLFTAEEFGALDRIVYSGNSAISFLQSAVQSLGMLISGDAGAGDLIGTVGIASEISARAQQSAQDLWYFVAYLSVNLAFVNLLPIPALDGGRLVFMLIELVRGKPINPKYEAYVSLAGMVILIGLFLFVTYNDIVRLVSG